MVDVIRRRTGGNVFQESGAVKQVYVFIAHGFKCKCDAKIVETGAIYVTIGAVRR